MTVRRVVFDHVLFVVADLDASRGLYTAALAPLGYEELYVQDDCVSYGAEDLDDFTICRGEPVTTAAHVAFSAEGRDAVDAFFAAAVANGATVRGEPGVWTQYSERYYAAFVNDLHQNNRRGRVARARAGRRRASPSRRSLIRTIQGTFANARAPQGSPSTRAEQKHGACGDTQQSKTGMRNLSRDGSAT